MKKLILHFVLIFLFVCQIGCDNNNNNRVNTYVDSIKNTKQISKDSIVNTYKYYFDNPLSEIKKQGWRRVVIDTVNDEFSVWIEAKFYLSDNEWIKIESENINSSSASSLETNTNYFLKDIPIKVGNEISSLLMKDSVEFNFDEQIFGLNIGLVQIKANCFNDIKEFEYDKILEARETKNIMLLPNKIKNCKVATIRVLNLRRSN